MLGLFVLDAESSERRPVFVRPATEEDLTATRDWQTNWTTTFAVRLPNKDALCRSESDELLGLTSYGFNQGNLAVEIIYLESARHSNANLLHVNDESRSSMLPSLDRKASNGDKSGSWIFRRDFGTMRPWVHIPPLGPTVLTKKMQAKKQRYSKKEKQ